MAHEDRVGVHDLVLLSELTENALVKNIDVRYKANRIYTYIHDVVVSMNPFKQIQGIYTDDMIQKYRGRFLYELPPHLSLNEHRKNQCIIISGESGAGKTEAAKLILRYIAAVSGGGGDVERVKAQLLESNPVLEAFGNAKTNRNNNSSRFGKYMEIQFDFRGAPVGGVIKNYLLEKSRVVNQQEGERNFHIFYNLMAGAPDADLNRMGLKRDSQAFHYTRQGNSPKVDGMNDAQDYKDVIKGMNVVGFQQEEQMQCMDVVATVIQLGQLEFDTDGQGSKLTSNLQAVCNLLRIPALTNRTIVARGDTVVTPLKKDQAYYARDALAKSLYDRLFNWLVRRLNDNIRHEQTKTVIGVLDIYGFEIFVKNSFEQLCINYCNEKLQQLFIELTLRSEQEEYVREGIRWTNIDYFDNSIICKLVEGKPQGVLAYLDEACLFPESTDLTFLDKLNKNFAKHNHYTSREAERNAKLNADEFTLRHYAGDVTYNVAGFLDKNNDQLFNDLVACMGSSGNPLVKGAYPPVDSKQRPITAGTQFKTSINALIETLLTCDPHYVRTIKPNNDKRADFFQEDLVRHQVKYLGLLENVRVRRAGFAYRQKYEIFLQRYKMLSKNTWPNFRGSPRDAVLQLLKDEKITDAGAFQPGTTKIFLKEPKTLFHFEDRRNEELPRIATLVQKCIRGWLARVKVRRLKAAMKIQAHYRSYVLRDQFEQQKASFALARYFRAFGSRELVAAVRQQLGDVANERPSYANAETWPRAPPSLVKGSQHLHTVYKMWKARRYIKSLSAPVLEAFERKSRAYDLFNGHKKWDLERPWRGDYLPSEDGNPERAVGVSKYNAGLQKLKPPLPGGVEYSGPCDRFKPGGWGVMPGWALVLTREHLQWLGKGYKGKTKPPFRIPLTSIKGIELSKHADDFIVLQIDTGNAKKDGDVLLRAPHACEIAVRLMELLKIEPKIADTVTFKINLKKSCNIDWQDGVPQSEKKPVEKTKAGGVIKAPK